MKKGQCFGYIRVSTREQHEDRQVVSICEAGVPKNNLFIDKQSGKDFNRPAYKKMVAKLKPGDTLFIKSIDRLGRNYQEIIEQWRIITKEKQIAIVVLDMPLLDTRQKGRDLTGVFVADMVLQILSYVAQTERDHNRQRQAEGIAIAKAKGVRFGRPPKSRPAAFPQVLQAWRQNKLSARAAGQQLGVTHQTFINWAKQREASGKTG